MLKKLFKIGILPVLVLLVINGCKKNPAKLQSLRVISGAGQCALPGEIYEHKLQIRADGSNGMPLSGQKVAIKIQPGSDLKCSAQTGITDAGGMVILELQAGKKIGDQYLLVIPEGAPDKTLSVRMVSGVKLEGGNQEGAAGETLEQPMTVSLFDENGSPRQGVPVFFSLVSEPNGAKSKLFDQVAVTNERGIATNRFKVGKYTGSYRIDVDVPGFRGIPVRQLGINMQRLLIWVTGGLALFIFGMKLMSSGLQNAAGERMRGLLKLFASNRFVAIIAGVVVTAVLQSSSASTVMVIGFINAGLLNLVQSIGIIFGANIGTTITAQLVAFDFEWVIMPAIIIGLILTFVTWPKLRGWGDMVLGFGLLFFGMKIMSGELKILADFPSFINFFATFNCAPVNGVVPFVPLFGAIMVGVIVTMAIQSSAATAGIVIALGAGGLINLYTAVALVLGSNIGTTITAVLASLPANRVAKQAALAHLLFNFIGVLMIGASFWINWKGTGVPVFFYLVNMITEGNVLSDIPQNLPRHIANAHTLFNVFTTLILIPFIPLIAKICEKVIPVGEGKIKYQYLEPHLLENPAIALEQTVNVMRRMLRKAWKMVDRSLSCHFMKGEVDEAKFEALAKKENRIDALQYEITSYLTQIMRRKLSVSQASVIPLLMHCTNDAERIADHTENILQLTRRLADNNHELSKSALKELGELRDCLNEQAEAAISLLTQYDSQLARRALGMEKDIARLADNFEDTHIQRLKERTCDAATGVVFIEMLNEINKVSARLSNIIERAGSISRNVSHQRSGITFKTQNAQD